MIVDDSPSVLRFLRAFLSRAGHDIVAEAHSAKSALEISKTTTFDLLVTDYILPDGNGYQVATNIKRNKSEVHIIIMTGEDSFKCEEFSVIRKPFDLEKMKRIIELINSDNQSKI